MRKPLNLHLLTTSPILQTVLQQTAGRDSRILVNAHSRVESLIEAASTRTPSLLLVDYLLFGRPATAALRELASAPACRSAAAWLLHPPGFSDGAAQAMKEFPMVRQLIPKPLPKDELQRLLDEAALAAESVPEPAASISPMIDPSSDLPALSMPPGATAQFAWSPQRGLYGVTNEAAQRAGMAAPFCFQMARTMAEAIGLGALAEVHFFSPDGNLSLVAVRDMTAGLLSSAHVDPLELTASARAKL